MPMQDGCTGKKNTDLSINSSLEIMICDVNKFDTFLGVFLLWADKLDLSLAQTITS